MSALQSIAWHVGSFALWIGLAAAALTIVIYVEGFRRR